MESTKKRIFNSWAEFIEEVKHVRKTEGILVLEAARAVAKRSGFSSIEELKNSNPRIFKPSLSPPN